MKIRNTRTSDELINSIKNGRFTLDGRKLKVGDFECATKGLTSLLGAPLVVNGDFIISQNLLSDLTNGPEIVDGRYIADSNSLKSLRGAPKKTGSFSVSSNMLTSLEGVPSEIAGWLYVGGNPITNLHDINKLITEVDAINLSGCDLQSHILGLLKIDRLRCVCCFKIAN